VSTSITKSSDFQQKKTYKYQIISIAQDLKTADLKLHRCMARGQKLAVKQSQTYFHHPFAALSYGRGENLSSNLQPLNAEKAEKIR
jgi:hypothetical protein